MVIEFKIVNMRPVFNWNLGSRSLELGKRTLVMGIVNVTPDSFSDGGKYFSSSAAIEHGLKLHEDGADILDIGGESTRPGAKVGLKDPAVSVEDELRRVRDISPDQHVLVIIINDHPAFHDLRPPIHHLPVVSGT